MKMIYGRGKGKGSEILKVGSEGEELKVWRVGEKESLCVWC